MDIQELDTHWHPTDINSLGFINCFDVFEMYTKPINSLNTCAYDIAHKLADLFSNFENECLTIKNNEGDDAAIEYINKFNEFHYVGWQFISLEDRIEQYKKGKDYPPFVKDTDNKLNFHKINIRFVNPETENGFGNFEAMVLNRKESIFVTDYSETETDSDVDKMADEYMSITTTSNDDIEILIDLKFFTENPKLYDTQNVTMNIMLIEACIAHELQHVIEMYVFRNHNTLNSPKGNLYKEFSKNIFGITDLTEFTEAKFIAYSITESEIRGRLVQLQTFLKSISTKCPQKLKKELLSKYNVTLYVIQNNDDLETKQSKSMTSAIINSELTQHIIYSKLLFEYIKKIGKSINKKAYQDVVCVLAYHMCQARMFNDKYFSFDNVKDIVNGKTKPEVIKLKSILQKLLQIFLQYQKDIYEMCVSYATDIFAQINLNEKLWSTDANLFEMQMIAKIYTESLTLV